MTKAHSKEDIVSYIAMNLSGLVSGFFLGDALRRIYNTFKNCRGLQQNEKVMLLHLIVFAVYTVTTALKTLQIGHWLSNKTKDNYNRSVVMYTISMWFLFFDQLVLCYLFYIFSAPISGIIDLHEGNFSVSSVAHSSESTKRVSLSPSLGQASIKLLDASQH